VGLWHSIPHYSAAALGAPLSCADEPDQLCTSVHHVDILQRSASCGHLATQRIMLRRSASRSRGAMLYWFVRHVVLCTSFGFLFDASDAMLLQQWFVRCGKNRPTVAQ
jgi:hypothetical protein